MPLLSYFTLYFTKVYTFMHKSILYYIKQEKKCNHNYEQKALISSILFIHENRFHCKF